MDEYEAERLLELTNEICDRLPAVIAERNELRARVHTLANQAQNLELKVARLELALAKAGVGDDDPRGDVLPAETVTQLAASYESEHTDLRAKLEAAANRRLERDDVDAWIHAGGHVRKGL